jgi:aryl-alcohol dehydrogenase-like predicted oxidoreductase
MKIDDKKNMNDEKQSIKGFDEYYLLGRSGLRVAPLCLGVMTFGTEGGWGCDMDTARKMFHRYLEVGGNFIDTADAYTNGHSEEMLGTFMAEAKNRDQLIVATKYTFNTRPGDPNAGGNARKNLYQALEGSLRRLKTDYVDLYWLHAWDTFTPAEEVIASLNDMVRSGKVRYIGLSNTPAWYLARVQTLAEQRGYERICALQFEYSLIERTIEREHIPAARELGMGICPWSPLGGGFLTGKYLPKNGGSGKGRLQIMKNSGNPAFAKFTQRNWSILDILLEVAEEIDRSPAQVAINWAAHRSGVVSTLIGATKMSQLEDNLRALEFTIPKELKAGLDEVSAPELIFPYLFFSNMQDMVTGGVKVRCRLL